MDARAWRLHRRRWKATHQAEIEELLAWLKTPEVWSVEKIGVDGVLEAVPEKRGFFKEYPRTRKNWVTFLAQYNISANLSTA